MRKSVWLAKNRRRTAAAGSIIGQDVAGARGSRPRKRATLHGLAFTAFPLAAGVLGVPSPSPSPYSKLEAIADPARAGAELSVLKRVTFLGKL